MPWLAREFKWSDETARKYMRLYEFAGKFQSDWNFDFSLQQLYHLTTPSTPAKARNEIFARAQAGEKHSTDLIRTVITAAKEPPAPSPCNRITALTESERPPGTMLMAQMLEIARQPNTEEEEKHSEVAATSASSDSLGQTYVRFAADALQSIGQIGSRDPFKMAETIKVFLTGKDPHYLDNVRRGLNFIRPRWPQKTTEVNGDQVNGGGQVCGLGRANEK